MIKLSDYVIKYLEEKGIRNVFMIPGGGCAHLVDSIGKSNIKYIVNLHEQGAGIAAEAYAQYNNEVSVALVTTGPGGTNIATPVAGAWLESTPMLILCGQVNTYDMINDTGVRQLGFQEIENEKIMKPITKFSCTVHNANDIKVILDSAFHAANDGRKGPVFVEIPLDIQSTMIDETQLESRHYKIKRSPELHINEIIQQLNKAKRPIILVGNGIRLSNAQEDFMRFIEKTKIPVLTSWKAADFLEEDHPLFVGRPGMIASRGANFNQQNSDFIICIGVRLDHGQIAFQSKYFARNAKKVIVDVSGTEIDKFKDMVIDFAIESDAKYFLTALNTQLDNITVDTTDWLHHCKQTYKKYPIVLPEHLNNVGDVNMYAFIETLSDVLPNDSLIVPGSSGMCSEVTFQSFKIKKGMRLLNTQGLGAMGFGIAASIGVCIASGNKKTVCIDGDGGFFMNIQELEVVKRMNLPIIYFVLNNDGYASIRATQNSHFGGHLVGSDSSSGLTLPDLHLTAQAFRLNYMKIENQLQLRDKLMIAINFNEPTICEIMIDKNHKSLPKASVKKTDDGKFVTLPMEDMAPFLPRDEFEQNIIKD